MMYHYIHSVLGILVLLLCSRTCHVEAEGRCSNNCRYGSDFCDVDNRCLFGCESGYHGDNCSLPCSIKNCLECVILPTTLEQCLMCTGNVYGPLCNLHCSRNCKGLSSSARSTCDPQGKCIYGCELGYHGDKCDEIECHYPYCKTCGVDWRGSVYCERCAAGYYLHVDHGCIPCSTTCSMPNDCNPLDGVCYNGCIPGMFGDQCDMICNIEKCNTCYTINGMNVLCSNCSIGFRPSYNQRECILCDTKCIGCDSATGECTSCGEGQFGSKCQYQCSIPGCKKCVFDTSARKPSCSECRDGSFTVFSTVDKVNICQNCSDTCEKGLCNNSTGNCFNCATGYYGRIAHSKGDSCRFKCSENCIGEECDQDTGVCECKSGWFDTRCTRICPRRCSSCEGYENGICPSCEPGYFGDACDKKCPYTCESRSMSGLPTCIQRSGYCEHGCIPGFYGGWCNETCSRNCDGGSCDKVTGRCVVGCTPYWYGGKCDKKCSSNCVADGVTSLNRPCDMVTGKCLEGCLNNYYGDKCDKICNYRCREQRCFQNSGFCKYGCMAGFTGTNCSEQCGQNCPEECTNCLNGYCDAKTKDCVTGCVRGFYGSNCQINCNSNCRDKNCDRNTGACFQCIDGFYGASCTLECSPTCRGRVCDQNTGKCGQCENGYYGDKCESECPKNCLSKICKWHNGECEKGCAAGFFGKQCDTECWNGWYGENCATQCGHCKDGTPCLKTDGRCISGCDDGYGGDACSYALSQSGPTVYDENRVAVIAGSTVSVLLVLCVVLTVAILCYCRSHKAKKAKREEPSVEYRTSHNSVQVIQPGTSVIQSESDINLHQVESYLLGVVETEIRCTGIVAHRDYYILHRGTVLKRGEREDAYVKVLLLNDTAEKKMHLAWLKKEVEILEICSSHSNIINLLATEEKPERFSVALSSCMQNNLMPYLHEIDLSDDEDIDLFYHHQLMQFAIDIIDALDYLHQEQIIHRYIRARSVYLSDNLVAKIGDFDFAITDEENSPSAEGWSRRDLPSTYSCWLAPEALISTTYSTQSDIWSYGVLLWEIFTLGQHPFDRMEGNKLERAIIDGQKPPKPGLASVSMYRLMKSCWGYSPEDRPTAASVYCQLTETQRK